MKKFVVFLCAAMLLVGAVACKKQEAEVTETSVTTEAVSTDTGAAVATDTAMSTDTAAASTDTTVTTDSAAASTDTTGTPATTTT